MSGIKKIKKIQLKKLDTKIPVYDICVESDNHNFVLDNNLIVHNCEPYAYLKNCIYERRILLPRKGINLLTEELVGLQRNNNSGKVDHTPQGINSKDSSDAVCGALFTASQHAEEYAFDFGESLESLVDFNQETDNVDSYMSKFEESLKQQPTFVKNTNVFNTFDNENDVSLDIFSGILNW